MRIEIIAIGDEVVSGYTVNENGSFIAKQLLEAGFCPSQHMAIGDDPTALQEAVQLALKRSDIVITTGGLGPTCDDLTKNTLAKLFHRPLESSSIVKEHLKKIFGEDLASLEEQSLQPKDATLFQNDLGTAWGFALEDRSLLIALPGVPSEMQGMFPQVKEYLQRKYATKIRPWVRVFHFLRLNELQIDPLLRKIEQDYPQVHCGVYPSLGTVTVRLSVIAHSEKEANALFAKPQEMLLEQFEDMRFESQTGKLDEAVHQMLLHKRLTVACAESCTAGALAASLALYPDSSKYFLGGIVSYANEVKKELLSVDSLVLEKKGAVSIEVASQMAEHARTLFRADIAIGVSGILGPSGGTIEKPVGTVCVSIARKDKPTHAWTMHLQGNRTTIREKTIQAILAELLKIHLR
jgi:competence/damage-inducible protein CinA-like protein